MERGQVLQHFRKNLLVPICSCEQNTCDIAYTINKMNCFYIYDMKTQHIVCTIIICHCVSVYTPLHSNNVVFVYFLVKNNPPCTVNRYVGESNLHTDTSAGSKMEREEILIQNLTSLVYTQRVVANGVWGVCQYLLDYDNSLCYILAFRPVRNLPFQYHKLQVSRCQTSKVTGGKKNVNFVSVFILPGG